MLSGDERLAIAENDIKSTKEDIIDLYSKYEDLSIIQNKSNMEYVELNLNVKGMKGSLDGFLVEMKEDRKIQNDRIDAQSKEIDKLKDKDANTAKAFMNWIAKNIGSIVVLVVGAFILIKLGLK